MLYFSLLFCRVEKLCFYGKNKSDINVINADRQEYDIFLLNLHLVFNTN